MKNTYTGKYILFIVYIKKLSQLFKIIYIKHKFVFVFIKLKKNIYNLTIYNKLLLVNLDLK